MNASDQKFIDGILKRQKHLYYLRWAIPAMCLAFCVTWAIMCWRATNGSVINLSSVLAEVSIDKEYNGAYILARDAAIKSLSRRKFLSLDL